MLGGINPAKMQGMMKKMGISQVPLNVHRVTFEMGNSKLVIDEPSVTKVTMQGQVTYQVAGAAREESAEAFSKEDIEMVIEKTGKSKKEVEKTLEETDGDIAEAIINLKS